MQTARLFIAVVFAGFGLLSAGCLGTDAQEATATAQETFTEVTYDSLLAARLGADDYGMRPYVMALLKAGPNRDQDSTMAAQLQQAHMANIARMADEGLLVLAGPFMDQGALRGIYVFNVATVEEARALTETDPAIQAGRLEMELRPWYGSAALQEMNTLSRRITKAMP